MKPLQIEVLGDLRFQSVRFCHFPVIGEHNEGSSEVNSSKLLVIFHQNGFNLGNVLTELTDRKPSSAEIVATDYILILEHSLQFKGLVICYFNLQFHLPLGVLSAFL